MAMQTPTTQSASGLSHGVGVAVSGLAVWGLSLCGVSLPPTQAIAVAYLVGLAVHHWCGPKGAVPPPPAATGARIEITKAV